MTSSVQLQSKQEEGCITYMMTPDKDYGQLVSENIFIYKPGYKGGPPEKLGVKEVCERYGIQRPEQVIDILGLMGDSVDNIPGIPGVEEENRNHVDSAIRFSRESCCEHRINSKEN
jgi:DNA polymerase-1